MVDIVDIGLRVDSTTVKSGERALDDFSKQAEKTQRDIKKLEEESKNYLSGIKKESEVFGFSSKQLRQYELDHKALTATERQEAQATIDSISAKEAYAATLRSVAIAAAAVSAAIALVATKLLMGAIPAAKEAEESAARLEAVLRATGHAAGLSAGSINSMAEALAATTQFDDESIRNAAATLATFRDVQGDTLREGIKLAADYAALAGGDVTSAAQAIGMALEGQRRGLLKLTEEQDKQIKSLQDQGRAAEAQIVVMDALKAKFGGTAEAMNSGITKSIKDLDKAWNELQEEIGTSVGPMFTSIVNGATAAANAMRQLISSANGTATDTRGGNWLETQTARINAMAGEISKAEADLASKRDNPLAFWLPSESDLRARIEAIKTVIVAESRALNQQVIAAGGRPITDDDRAASAGAASERRRAAEQSAAQLAAAREEALKRNDLRPDVAEGEFGPDESQFGRAIARQKERHEAETQLWAQNEADKSRLLQEGINQRIAQEQVAAQIIHQTQSATFSAVGDLFGVFASKSKAAALAQLAITKGYAIFEILARSKVAAAMALGPPLGPVAGAPLASSITAWGYANAAAVGASGVAGAIQINQGNFGAGSSNTAGGSGFGGSTSSGVSAPASAEPSAAPRGVTQFTIVANNNGIAYLDYASIIILGEKMREASLRGDLIILDPQSRNAQDIAAQSIVQAA